MAPIPGRGQAVEGRGEIRGRRRGSTGVSGELPQHALPPTAPGLPTEADLASGRCG